MKQVLKELFVNLNAQNISYCIIRDYESPEMINQAEDLDVSVDEGQKELTIAILEKAGWFTPHRNLNTYSHQQFFKWDGERIYKLDIIWGMYFADGEYKYTNPKEIYENTGLLQEAKIPNATIGLKILLLHVVFDKQHVSPKNLKQVERLYYDEECVKNDAVDIVASGIVKFGDSEMENLARYKQILLGNSIVSLEHRILWRIQRLYQRVYAHFAKKQLSIAAIGVDGSGKSTLVKSISEYFGDKAFVQYFGFREFQTKPAIDYFSSDSRSTNPAVRLIKSSLILWREMWYRLKSARRSDKPLLIFDRYVWEAYDNAERPIVKALYYVLFHIFFAKPDNIIYLYCPVETSLERKDDIVDVVQFEKMKRRFDATYLKEGNLTINTAVTPTEQIKGLAAEYICRLSDGAII